MGATESIEPHLRNQMHDFDSVLLEDFMASVFSEHVVDSAEEIEATLTVKVDAKNANIAQIRKCIQDIAPYTYSILRLCGKNLLAGCKLAAFQLSEDSIVKHPQIKKASPPSYRFNKVFAAKTTNAEVYTHVAPAVETFLQSLSGCLIADGQTGSGQTYSMFAGPDALVECSAADIMRLKNEVKLAAFGHVHYEKSSQVLDLLTTERKKDCKELSAAAIAQRSHAVRDLEHFLSLIHEAKKSRRARTTSHNTDPSRGHLVIILSLCRKDMASGHFAFVDLAGSETMVKGDHEETQFVLRSRAELHSTILTASRASQANKHTKPTKFRPSRPHGVGVSSIPLLL